MSILLKILQADITQIKADAIVNAANKTLLGGGGVDGAIHQAAGPELLEECKTLGGCETGQAKITKAYNLPAKFIIHTVGPIYGAENGQEGELLANCYRNSLKLAEQNGVKTIAFPCISTGAFHFPQDEAAKIAITTVKNYFGDNHQTSVESVTFVTFSELDCNIYKQLLEFGEFNLIKPRPTRARAARRLLIVPIVLGLILDSIFIYKNWGNGLIYKATPAAQAAYTIPIQAELAKSAPAVETEADLCDNYKEIQEFKNPVPIVWTAKLTGCLVSCYGAHFTRLPEGAKYKYLRFAGYYPDAAGKYDWEKGGSQIPDKFLEDGLKLRVYGKWTGIEEDHPKTVFDNKCVPIVNIDKIEIAN